MSRIRFTGSTTPPTPASGQLFLFVDSADKHLKQIDDTGTISDITGGAGTDTTAIHDDTAAEISVITAKATPTGSDFLLIEDAADSNNKKRITIGNLPSSGGAGTDTTAIHDDTSAEISAITAKVTPTGSDFLLIEDAAASHSKKRITIGDLPSSAGSDTTAIHDNTAAEISVIAAKATPTGSDFLLIEDAADSNNKKRITIGNLPSSGGAGTDTTAIHDDTAAEISAITAKATPTGSDFLLIEDAADSNNKKRITIGNLPSSGSADYGALSSPPTGGTYLDGDRYFDTTIARAMFRDTTRSKWLSVECLHVAFMTAYALDEGEYLNIGHLYLDPSALGNDRGYQVPLVATIVGIGWAKDSSNTTPIIEILSDASVIATVSPPTSTAGNKGSDLTIDADMAADSVIACRNKDQGSSPSAQETIYMPVVWVDYRWKR